MVSDIGEKNMASASEAQANLEYHELLRERTEKVMIRDKELQKKGLPVGLDGPNYYADIQEWFLNELQKIKDKYGIK